MTSPGVVNVSGHMIDAPDRDAARFPPSEEPRVTDAIRSALEGWDVGPGTVLLSGGALGTDLIAAEQALELGAAVVLCLARPPEHYVERSVHRAGTAWAARFDAIREAASEVRVLPAEYRAAYDSIFEATNAWMIETGKEYAPSDLDRRALIVWDGREGDGPGGTRDFCVRLGFDDLDDDRIAVIDPTPRFDRRG